LTKMAAARGCGFASSSKRKNAKRLPVQPHTPDFECSAPTRVEHKETKQYLRAYAVQAEPARCLTPQWICRQFTELRSRKSSPSEFLALRAWPARAKPALTQCGKCGCPAASASITHDMPSSSCCPGGHV
jgi:hypothetical protein